MKLPLRVIDSPWNSNEILPSTTGTGVLTSIHVIDGDPLAGKKVTEYSHVFGQGSCVVFFFIVFSFEAEGGGLEPPRPYFRPTG
jgi:hypothetical protein